jgi:hypothetical protein
MKLHVPEPVEVSWKETAYIWLVFFPLDVVENAWPRTKEFGIGAGECLRDVGKEILYTGADAVGTVGFAATCPFSQDARDVFREWEPNSTMFRVVKHDGIDGVERIVVNIPQALYQSTVVDLLSGDPRRGGRAFANTALLLAPVPKTAQALKGLNFVKPTMNFGGVLSSNAVVLSGQLSYAIDGSAVLTAAQATAMPVASVLAVAAPYRPDSLPDYDDLFRTNGDYPESIPRATATVERLGEGSRRVVLHARGRVRGRDLHRVLRDFFEDANNKDIAEKFEWGGGSEEFAVHVNSVDAYDRFMRYLAEKTDLSIHTK